MTSQPENIDVLIIGAGISGIGAAHHLQERCPGKSYAILEARASTGGTWDLFRYPGIRSDSDMHTLGYRFRPWTAAKSRCKDQQIFAWFAAIWSRITNARRSGSIAARGSGTGFGSGNGTPKSSGVPGESGSPVG